MLNILSLGLGIQSTALYLMSSLGELPRFEYAIFADLGKEGKKTYAYLEWLREWKEKNNGIEIIVIQEKNLYKHLLEGVNSTSNRFASIPAYTKNVDGTIGMLKRQCTSEYKIAQVDRLIRFHIYKSQAYKRLPLTRIYKGISFDELTRMSIPQESWKIEVYPFCGWESYAPGKARKITDDAAFRIMTRNQIINWYIAMGLPVPPKSSCVFCPFRSEPSWYEMKTKEPEDFEAACLVDDAIRDSSKRGITQPLYLHESCVPLREVILKQNAPDLWSGNCGSECGI